MSKERELLERALNHWDDCEDISDSYLVGNVMEEIRDFLASEKQDQPEPVAWMLISTVGSRHYHMIEQQALKGLQMYGGKVIALYDHPAPQRSFVRLSDLEIVGLFPKDGLDAFEFAHAIMDALETKNTTNKSDPDSINLQSKCRGDKQC